MAKVTLKGNEIHTNGELPESWDRGSGLQGCKK